MPRHRLLAAFALACQQNPIQKITVTVCVFYYYYYSSSSSSPTGSVKVKKSPLERFSPSPVWRFSVVRCGVHPISVSQPFRTTTRRKNKARVLLLDAKKLIACLPLSLRGSTFPRRVRVSRTEGGKRFNVHVCIFIMLVCRFFLFTLKTG